VPKYKSQAVVKLFNNLGIFFNEAELSSLSFLDSISSTRDSIAHGDFGVQITRREVEGHLDSLDEVMNLLVSRLA
jgi:hypothetical protein